MPDDLFFLITKFCQICAPFAKHLVAKKASHLAQKRKSPEKLLVKLTHGCVPVLSLIDHFRQQKRYLIYKSGKTYYISLVIWMENIHYWPGQYIKAMFDLFTMTVTYSNSKICLQPGLEAQKFENHWSRETGCYN